MNDNRPRRWTRTVDAVLAGVSVLLLLVYLGVVYKNDRKYISDLADETITFMESVCQRYDNYELGNQAKTRQDLLETADVLTDFVVRDELENQDFLTEFARRNSLSGVLVLDRNQIEIGGVDLDGRDAYTLWKPKLEEASLKNIFEYPRKTYCGTMTLQGISYEVALTANEDVAVLCYIEGKKIKTDVYEPSIDKILTNNTFHKNPVIIITDGTRILASNGNEIKQNVPVNKAPITNAGDLSHYEGKLIHLKRGPRSWYGKRAVYGRYYIYIFYPAKEVFTNMIALVLGGITVYAILCMCVLLVRQHSEKEYFRRERKQLNTVRAISSIYVTTAIFHLHRMEFEEILCSDRMRDLIGENRKASDVVEILASHIIAPEFRKDYLDFMNPNTMRERLRGVKNRSAMFRDVNGTWYLCILIPQQLEENGEVRDVLIAARNVNDYKQSEERYKEELRKSARDAELANGVKSSFLRRMSHDVRTPVNGIRGMAVIAKRVASEPERVKECMDKIIFSSDYLQDLLDDILRMSKLESGEIAFEERTFNLKNVLRDIEFFMEEQAEEKKVHLTMDIEKITHPIVIGSPLHVRQVIQNLVSNAVKFNHEGGSVEVCCREVGKAPDDVRMKVNGGVSDDDVIEYEFVIADTGIGMSQEFQNHMFEVFAQEENTARTTYSGNGLGLPIAKELIDRMGGSVDFVSKRGFGTTFTVRIPMKADPRQEEERREADKKSFSIRGVRILIAEDNELNMEIAKTLLEDEGALITEAHDGREAVEIFSSRESDSFDVILMDIMMPEMDGLEASRTIRSLDREDAQTIPIFAMTANAFIDDKKRSRLVGMNEHLSKPLDMQEVVEMIHCYCCADRA